MFPANSHVTASPATPTSPRWSASPSSTPRGRSSTRSSSARSAASVAAAIDLDERRTIANPFVQTAYLRAQLHVRAAAFDRRRRMPEVADRIRAALARNRPAYA